LSPKFFFSIWYSHLFHLQGCWNIWEFPGSLFCSHLLIQIGPRPATFQCLVQTPSSRRTDSSALLFPRYRIRPPTAASSLSFSSVRKRKAHLSLELKKDLSSSTLGSLGGTRQIESYLPFLIFSSKFTHPSRGGILKVRLSEGASPFSSPSNFPMLGIWWSLVSVLRGTLASPLSTVVSR